MSTTSFSTDVKVMADRIHIGPYDSWIEDGYLRVYGHEVGHPVGSSVKMTPQEALVLLEWLAKHHEEISLAARSR